MSNNAKIRETVKKLNPIDDIMFRKMAEDISFCEEILRVFLEDPGLKVTENTPQFSVTNLQGRSAILDAVCVLSNSETIGVEIQKADKDNHEKRVRYIGSLLTTNITDPGIEFKNVPNVCVVYVANFDIFKAGKSIYHFDRILRETGQARYNGFREVYINGESRDDSLVSKLMQVFTENDVYDEKHFPRTSHFKELYKKGKGQKDMCDIVQTLIDEEKALGRAEGREEERKNTIRMLNKSGIPTTSIAKIYGMAIDDVAKILKIDSHNL